jgi:protoporphyrinogen oxidase
MFNCCKRKKPPIHNDTNIHKLLNKLVELNITYNTEFNKITNEINKIKLKLENKAIYELDSVRKNTPISTYIPSNFRTNSIIEIMLENKYLTSCSSTTYYV